MSPAAGAADAYHFPPLRPLWKINLPKLNLLHYILSSLDAAQTIQDLS
jgi:hypothetical protein